MTGQGSVGRVGRLRLDNEKRVLLNQRVGKFVPRQSLDLDYFYYIASTPYYEQIFFNAGIGSGQPNLSPDDIKNIEIPIPPLKAQKAIAHILSSFDRAIFNLRKQNKTLEKIAQTLFNRWFVDFEFPNADGKPYKSSGGAMEPSELGEMPAGWRVGKLGDVGKNIRDGISEDDIQPEMSYIALEHMPRKQVALDSWGTADDIASNKFIFKKGNILFGKLRPYFHKVGVAFIPGICSTDILVLDSKRKELFGFLLMIVSSDELIRYVSLAAEGTRMPRTSWQYMKEYPICIPDDSVTSAFNHLVKALITKIENNIFQIQTLTQTRDVLLPKLMSGKLRVKD
jgi:type I restriction enzyme S subunit